MKISWQVFSSEWGHSIIFGEGGESQCRLQGYSEGWVIVVKCGVHETICTWLLDCCKRERAKCDLERQLSHFYSMFSIFGTMFIKLLQFCGFSVVFWNKRKTQRQNDNTEKWHKSPFPLVLSFLAFPMCFDLQLCNIFLCPRFVGIFSPLQYNINFKILLAILIK